MLRFDGEEFLEKNAPLSMIIRAHECVMVWCPNLVGLGIHSQKSQSEQHISGFHGAAVNVPGSLHHEVRFVLMT